MERNSFLHPKKIIDFFKMRSNMFITLTINYKLKLILSCDTVHEAFEFLMPKDTVYSLSAGKM